MKQTTMATVFAMLLGLAAWAQTPGNTTSPQGTDPSAPATTQPQTMPSQTPDTSTQSAADQSKGEKKLKGCIASEGGNYVLQDTHGKEITLGGTQDFTSHVGHTVTVHGSFAGTGDTAASGSGAGMSSGGQFTVTKIDMVSDSCKDGKEKNGSNGKPSPNQK